MRPRRWWWAVVAATAAAACAGGPGGTEAPSPAEEPPGAEVGGRQGARPPVPPGYGTLRQDAFTVWLRAGDLQVKVTPLAEEVIRLAAPDTYERLREIARTHGAWARDAAVRAGLGDEPLLFLVSFFTFGPRSEYTPTDLQIVSQGRLHRVLDLAPVTPGFGAHRLLQEETQIAVYAFRPSIDLGVPMRVGYGPASSDAWEQILTLLEAERARVLARTKPAGPG